MPAVLLAVTVTVSRALLAARPAAADPDAPRFALAAPAIIGGVAEVTSLPAAMSVMTALLVVVPLAPERCGRRAT